MCIALDEDLDVVCCQKSLRWKRACCMVCLVLGWFRWIRPLCQSRFGHLVNLDSYVFVVLMYSDVRDDVTLDKNTSWSTLGTSRVSAATVHSRPAWGGPREQTDPEYWLSHHTSSDASMIVLVERDALNRADSGRLFHEQLQEQYVLVVYLDPTPQRRNLRVYQQ